MSVFRVQAFLRCVFFFLFVSNVALLLTMTWVRFVILFKY